MSSRPPQLLKLPSVEVDGKKAKDSKDAKPDDEHQRLRKREKSITLKEVASHEDLARQNTRLKHI